MTWPGARPFAAGAILFAAGCTMRSPESRLEPALRQPLVFRWTEVTPIDATAPSHHGGVVFLVRSDTVYSLAWPDPTSGRNWPVVFGTGRCEGMRLIVNYSTLGPNPAHDFYRAECRVEIAADLGGFHCEYLQRTDPQTDDLKPGEATGTRESSAEAAAQIDALFYRLHELGVEALGRSGPQP